MIEVLVSCNGIDRYPALIDPGDQREGHVKPWFDLETVQRIADDTQAGAARFGHGSLDTIHVLTGQVDSAEHAVVLNVCWMYLGGEKRQEAVEVCQPNEVGRYAIGGFEWCWYALDERLNPAIPHQVKREQLPPFPGQRAV
ncbi:MULTISPECIES: hypothetical protein [unclassified Streptomyces]|uniref:hypothetical protein n=1 Tax=unclassified Streptomyces TaxID=2593676 RepID=UPI002023F2B0|nr:MULTISPECIES: hypothetical protein [unclassified Streptomyces]MCX4550577.1 hypothetical protein [Streptomyces sp. NBC_01500]WSC22024.1 hypothetical protein OIE60_21350 [Streptomyces sp. NBC_01766]